MRILHQSSINNIYSNHFFNIVNTGHNFLICTNVSKGDFPIQHRTTQKKDVAERSIGGAVQESSAKERAECSREVKAEVETEQHRRKT